MFEDDPADMPDTPSCLFAPSSLARRAIYTIVSEAAVVDPQMPKSHHDSRQENNPSLRRMGQWAAGESSAISTTRPRASCMESEPVKKYSQAVGSCSPRLGRRKHPRDRYSPTHLPVLDQERKKVSLVSFTIK